MTNRSIEQERQFSNPMSNLPRGSEFSSLTPQERQAFMRANRDSLLVFGITNVEQLQDRVNASQKGNFGRWMAEYVYSPDYPILGTFWKLISAKPVEGVVNAIPYVNKVPLLGKIARWGTVAAAVYFGVPYLFGGWGRAEGNAASVGIDWLNRRNESLQTLGSAPSAATPPDMGSGDDIR